MDSVLLEDNPHWVKKPNKVYNDYVHREALDRALAYLSAKEIIAIMGARRVGKSSLAKLMIKSLLQEVNPQNIFFINLEKPSFIPYKNDPTYLEKIYDAYLKLANPNMDEKIYFFIDEIQILTHGKCLSSLDMRMQISSLLLPAQMPLFWQALMPHS